ncbi:MAG: polyprenyl diphosphate synthase, partial [Devosia sp.]
MSIDPAISAEIAQRPRLRIPRHLGVIMDGNGRWAQARGKRRTEGHIEGVKALRNLVEHCIGYGVAHLTVFSFSSENWTRPKDEISFIFNLLRRFVASDLQRLIRNNVRVRIIGSREGLEHSLVRLIDDVEAKTASNTGLVLIVAF